MNEKRIVGTFDIPESMAQHLSDLLIKQGIRDRVLKNCTDDAAKFSQMENMLIPIEREINLIKMKISTEHVPEEYRSSMYVWNYDGYDIAGTKVYVFSA